MASEICCVEDVRLRGILLEKFIEVAKVSHCPTLSITLAIVYIAHLEPTWYVHGKTCA